MGRQSALWLLNTCLSLSPGEPARSPRGRGLAMAARGPQIERHAPRDRDRSASRGNLDLRSGQHALSRIQRPVSANRPAHPRLYGGLPRDRPGRRPGLEAALFPGTRLVHARPDGQRRDGPWRLPRLRARHRPEPDRPRPPRSTRRWHGCRAASWSTPTVRPPMPAGSWHAWA